MQHFWIRWSYDSGGIEISVGENQPGAGAFLTYSDAAMTRKISALSLDSRDVPARWMFVDTHGT